MLITLCAVFKKYTGNQQNNLVTHKILCFYFIHLRGHQTVLAIYGEDITSTGISPLWFNIANNVINTFCWKNTHEMTEI